MTQLSSWVHTFGCRLNQFDGDALTRLLGESGFPRAASDENAHVHIVNSCTITEQAKREAERFSRKLARAHPQAHIVWTGCAASSEQGAALLQLPNVALVVDNADKTLLPTRLREHLHLGPPAAAVDAPPELPVAPFGMRSRALLKVQDGCDYRCSFCIVPQVRGPSRSLPCAHIEQQLQELLERGAPEVVITGVHLGTWGRDLSPRQDIAGLLRVLLPSMQRASWPSRLRLSSIDPHEWSEQATKLFREFAPVLCRSLHLPTQSLCPATLRSMRRAHRAEHFEEAVTHLTTEVPGIGIGTDIIVGHPGETRAQFDETFDRLARLPLSYLHVFGYSERHNTAAASFPNAVAPSERKRRVRALRELSAQMHERFVARAMGQQAEVVVHLDRSKSSHQLVGMTDAFIKVHFDGPDSLLGQRARVRVDAPHAAGARGTLLQAGWAQALRTRSSAGRHRLQLLG